MNPTALVLEEGTEAGYTMVLGTRPSGSVTVEMTTDLAGTDLSVRPRQVVFSQSDWNVPRIIVVRSARDDDEQDEPARVLTP